MNNFEASFLGRIEYSQAVQLQENLFNLVKQKNINAILGLEHPVVMTLGHRIHSDLELGRSNIDMPQVQSSRGGLATIHSEGQLVIYPILDLRSIGWGVKQYVQKLLYTTKELLQNLNIESHVDEKEIGLHTLQGKIAFCGIQVKHGISQHGISLNVRNDLSLFQSISSCGVENAALDRLQNYNVNLTLNELFQQWVDIFKTKLN